ncbi:50S ribosomal protein L24 [Candidatus Falkowbacteria bacterium]|nr:50S ribosomal protein L24 [Candidatus Falkowbacteria bacterium]
MKLKTNDKVQIISGRDKGKSGKILQVFRDANKVVVEGLNLSVKNTRPRKMGEKGQQIQFPAPLDVSKVMLLCPQCGEVTRIGYQMAADSAPAAPHKAMQLKGKKFRRCRQCQQTID